MNLCKDCQHSRGDDRFMECHAPKNQDEPDPLFGHTRLRWTFCDSHRTDNGVGWFWCRALKLCGKEGRWFEPK